LKSREAADDFVASVKYLGADMNARNGWGPFDNMPNEWLSSGVPAILKTHGIPSPASLMKHDVTLPSVNAEINYATLLLSQFFQEHFMKTNHILTTRNTISTKLIDSFI
jgi:hypothetical protein